MDEERTVYSLTPGESQWRIADESSPNIITFGRHRIDLESFEFCLELLYYFVGRYKSLRKRLEHIARTCVSSFHLSPLTVRIISGYFDCHVEYWNFSVARFIARIPGGYRNSSLVKKKKGGGKEELYSETPFRSLSLD